LRRSSPAYTLFPYTTLFRSMVEAINNEDLSKIDTDAGERVSRLTLNTDDNEFFKNLVLSPQNERSGVRATRRSHRLISDAANQIDRKSTRLNSSHLVRPYAA